MKKKALSLILALCMIVSLMSAQAFAGTQDNYKAELNVSENDSVSYNGQSALQLGFGVQSDGKTLRNLQNIVFAIDLNVFDLITNTGKPADDSFVPEFPHTSVQVPSGKYIYSTYQSSGSSWSANAYYALNAEKDLCFVILQPYQPSVHQTCTSEIELASILVGLKEGKTKEDAKNGSIRLATPEEASALCQSAVASITDGSAGGQLDYLYFDGRTSTLDPVTVDFSALTGEKPIAPQPPVTPEAPTFAVNAAAAVGGSVSVDAKTAAEGETVTVTAAPAEGYTVDAVTVSARDGKNVAVKSANGVYTFKMPASAVDVKVTFKALEETKPETGFSDVSSDAYYADAVAWAVEKDVTKGTGANTFSPDKNCTRGEIVTFLQRASFFPIVMEPGQSFTDVAPNAYYADAVAWAVGNKITNGTSATTFSPNKVCTRGEIVTFLWRASGAPVVDSSASRFTDVAADAYYANAVAWAVEKGVTTGTGADTFSPNAPCTRAQSVTFLFRSVNPAK